MPYTEEGLPFATGSNTSYKAAKSIDPKRRGEKTRLYLRCLGLYAETDHEMARRLNVPLSSITSIRNNLVQAGLVTKCGEAMGPYSKPCTTWGLTDSGRAAVSQL